MSYNSKKARNLRAKAQIKRAELGKGAKESLPTGNKGPAKTGKKNSKRNTWFAKLSGKVIDTAPVKKARDEDGDAE